VAVGPLTERTARSIISCRFARRSPFSAVPPASVWLWAPRGSQGKLDRIWSLYRNLTSKVRPDAGASLLRRNVVLLGRRAAGLHRVWILNAAIVGGSVVLLAGPVRGYEPIASPELPWWLLAFLVAATERWPVHLEFRRSAHSFSLTDVPVTIALIFCGGPAGVAAIAAGSVVALALRQLPPVKFVFNLAQFVFTTALGYVVVHAIAGPGAAFGPWVWFGVFVGLQLGGLVTIALITAAMWISEGSLSREQIRQMFGMDAVVTATNTSLALLLVVIIVEEPRAAPIIVIPLGIAFLGYRAYVAERQRHEKLEFLYEANRSLSQSREVAQALVGLLQRALEAYRSEQAEVILYSSEGSPPLRTSLGPGDTCDSMVPVAPADAAALSALLAGRTKPITVEGPLPDGVRTYLESRGVRHAMLAELRGEERTVGLIMLANRSGVSRRFTADDLALFDTLAANASAALQYDRLEQAVSELRDLQEQLHHQAYHDPLTGQANRALFRQEVRSALEAPGERGIAVLFIDVDDFKTVNDTLGHAVGDQLLRAAARRLSACIRGGDLVARLGGDEFAILCRPPDDAERRGVDVAERVLAAFEVPVSVANHVLPVRLSVGVATSAHSGGCTEDLLRDADVAMYEAKETGKGRYAVFDPAMRDVVMRRHGLREELERALAQRELKVRFQPIIDLDSGQTRAMEALVRWEHPTRGSLAPLEFIPIAEETGLIVPLGRFVLEEACRRAQGWEGSGPPLSVQVNLSARELEHEQLIETVTSVLRETGIDPRRLVLEITETLLVRDAEKGAATLNALRDVGVRLALDDFGTGYSSLSYLRTLPLDVLKIAKEFVDGITVSAEDAAFVRLIVELAGTVGLTVIAEGIESAEQLHILQQLGCDQGQGFLYAAPLEDERPWMRNKPARFARSES
jgi:diguanylate cyclase (GGDEF)-like protein